MNHPSRRNLIRAAAFVSVSAVRSSAANSAVSVGLIGAGGRGTYDAGLLVKNTGARITALCDVVDTQIERARKTIPTPDAKVYKDYRDLLASEVDAVIIATPVFLHPGHFEAAVKAGKHIYIEKPAGADVEGCKRLMRAADAADRRFHIQFGFQQRYGPLSRKAHQLVSSGGIGKLRLAHSHWFKGGIRGTETPAPRPATDAEKLRHWKDWKETLSDFIVETYCHGIDVLNWFLGGHPVKALATGTQTSRRGDMRDQVTAVFTYPSGVQASLSGTQLTPLHYRGVHETFVGETSVVETARHYWKHYQDRDKIAEERETREITIDALEDFVNRVRDGRPENTGVRGAETTLTEILARMSMDLRREVTWEEMMR